MFQTTNQILSYIKYRNHQKDRNVLPGWYGWYWPHRVSRFNRCELPSYFCCEPIIEFLVPSFLLSFLARSNSIHQRCPGSRSTHRVQWGKDVDAVLPWRDHSKLRCAYIYILYHIYPYLSISMDVHRNLDTMEPRPQTTAKGNPEGPSRQWGYQETTTWENQFIGRSPNGHHFLGRAVDGSWDPDLEVS